MIAVLADVHCGDPGPIQRRRGELGAILLRRAVERLRRYIQPDLVVVLGDLLDQPESPRAEDYLRELRDILDRLICPYLVLPGNHDPIPERFYAVLPKPPSQLTVAGARFLCFVDSEELGYHARRNEEDLARLRGARQDGFAGPLVTLQHVPVMPRGHEVKYGYTNASEVLAAQIEAGVGLCVGGHCHQAAGPVAVAGTTHLAVEALCESPHAYTLVTLGDSGDVSVERQTLAMPTEYGLADLHSHTQFAYCANGVSIAESSRVASAMGLRTLAFTEHSGHLYFSRDDFASGRACAAGVGPRPTDVERTGAYFEQVRSHKPPLPIVLGMEIDTAFSGAPLIRAEDRTRLQWAVGAVHFVPPEARENAGDFADAFRFLTRRICESGVDTLAHPFRIFRRSRREVPPELYPWVVGLLKETGVAAEINFHTNEPHPMFVQACLESGVPLTLASDAHELWEVGEFFPHLSLLGQLGVAGDPSRYLRQPAGLATASATPVWPGTGPRSGRTGAITS